MNPFLQTYGISIAISLILYSFTFDVIAQISPGDLAEPHAHLEGLSNCTKCHILGEKVSNEKCLDCHLEIKTRLDNNRGYHASSGIGNKACAECHNDHHGRKFQMIRFDTDQFDHNLTGYSLEGAHARISCRECHRADFIKDSDIGKKSSTYLGLEKTCNTCHEDVHRGSLSNECASCHDTKAFKPASKFDHTRARFKLSGKHAEIDCYACHKISIENGKEIRNFTGIPYGNCTSCHRDIHDNKFGQNCTKCHSEVSFHVIKGLSNFNHSLTNYALEGKHQGVACLNCHKTGYGEKIRFNLCSDCHTDYHNGQFMVQGKSPDCNSCHSTGGFEITTYSIESHNKTKFPISGAHLATPCFDCHKKSEKWNFREIGETCNDCHKNTHESYMDAKYYPGGACESCHRESRWSEVEFDHNSTGYILEGAHNRQTCRECHFREDEQGRVVQQFSKLTSGCLNCHGDIHHGQFETTGKSCLKCHDYFDWTAGMFNHNKTAFPLDGKHKDVACVKCHKKVESGEQAYTIYKIESFKCESCH